MTTLNPDFWQNHFEKHQIPWDRGSASPQLMSWLETQVLQPCRIAIPGCGQGWEVATLAARDFQVVGIDYTEAAVSLVQEKLLSQGLDAEIIQADVLEYQPEIQFDAVYEQTCLCAISPDYWVRYAIQLQHWIKPGGALYLIFMQINRPGARKGLVQGPPFHCDINAMHALFNPMCWAWPEQNPVRIEHPQGWSELAIRLLRKPDVVLT